MVMAFNRRFSSGKTSYKYRFQRSTKGTLVSAEIKAVNGPQPPKVTE